MNIDAVIQRLETISELSGKVEIGHPTLMESIGSTPRVWISSIAESAGANQRINAPVRQRIMVRIDLVIGARSSSEMTEIRSKIQGVLINFQSEPKDDPMTKGHGQMEFLDPAWTTWVDTYETAYQLDSLS